MTLTIEFSDKLEAALQAQALKRGIPADRFAQQVLETVVAANTENDPAGEPFETGYGIFAKFGPAPSAEEIDANRAEMFHGFGRD